MRQLRAGVERRAALVVDQHERQVIRARRHGQTSNQGAQQLALAGARRAGQQRMRSVAIEIDVDDAIARHADHRSRHRVGTSSHPRRGDGRRPARRQQRQQRHVPWDSAGATQRILRVDQVTEAVHQARRAAFADPRAARLDGQAGERRVGMPTRTDRSVQVQQRCTDMRHPLVAADHHDQCHRALADHHPPQRAGAGRQQVGRVGHHDDMRVRGHVVLGDDLQQIRLPDHGHRPGGRGGMWQSLQPAPARRLAGDDHDAHIGRATVRRELHDQRADRRPSTVGSATDCHSAGRPDVRDECEVGEERDPTEVAGRPPPICRRIHHRRPGHAPEPDRHGEAVVMGRAPAPQLDGPTLDRPPRRHDSRVVHHVMVDEPGSLRGDGKLVPGNRLHPRSSLAAPAAEHGEPVPTPRAEGHDRAQGPEDQEHRLVQERGHESRAGQCQQRRKHPTTGISPIAQRFRRVYGIRCPPGCSTRATDHDTASRCHRDVCRIHVATRCCEITPGHREHAVADLQPGRGGDSGRFADRLTVDADGHSTRQLPQHHTVARRLDQQVMGFERSIIALHCGTASASDHVRAVPHYGHAARVGPGLPRQRPVTCHRPHKACRSAQSGRISADSPGCETFGEGCGETRSDGPGAWCGHDIPPQSSVSPHQAAARVERAQQSTFCGGARQRVAADATSNQLAGRAAGAHRPRPGACRPVE